ncbi:MAG TPA: folate-binding protein [Burkholderiaceae bacterium]|nr:folate-binding protein [Burkholderiaceae bacterium]
MRRRPVLARLDGLGRIRVEGPDAVTFLQSQLTSDVAGRGTEELQLNGYCSAKGRLLASFHQWRDGDGIELQLPREILAPVMKRLSMFVLRLKAKIADDSARHIASALIGRGAGDVLARAGIEPPAQPWSMTIADGLRVARMPAAPGVDERFMLLADAGSELERTLGVDTVGEALWWWSEIAAAVPTVFAATQERFVPQMINFEVLGGVSFKKGCYPGQEVVARSQYLGKLKRRMHPGHAAVDQPPAAGADIYHSAEAGAVGTVVMSATAPDGGVDLLVELPVAKLESGELHLGNMPAGRIEVRPLPYALFDPTA